MAGFLKFSGFRRIQKILSNYWIVGYSESGNFRISFKDFYNQLELASSTGGGTPIFFEGNNLPSENNEGEALQKGDWAFLTPGVNYVNIGGGSNIVAPPGRMSIAIFNGTSFVLKDMGALPDKIDVYNVTTEVPLGSGYYTKDTAIAAVPEIVKKRGLTIIFEEANRVWKRFTYVAPSLSTWLISSSWIEEFVGKGIDTSIFEKIEPKMDIDLRDIISKISVKVVSSVNNQITYIDENKINPIVIHSIGFTGTDYRIRLAEKVGDSWVVSSTPEFNQVGGVAPTVVTFDYRMWKITLTISKWVDFSDFSDYNVLNSYLFYGSYYNNKIDNFEVISGLTFSTSSSLDSVLEFNSDGVLLVNMPAVSVLFNKRHSAINVSPVGAVKTVYSLKRQEFLYVDVPKSWAIYAGTGGTINIQHGNYVAAVTDERGTIPQASLVSPDAAYIRYIILETGNSAYMITKNSLPQNAAARRLNSKIFQYSKTLNGVDLNDIIEDLTVEINSNTNEINTYNVDRIPEMAIYSMGRQSGISKVRIGEFVNGSWSTTEIYSNSSNSLEFSATYRHFTLYFKLRSWNTFAEFFNSHRLNSLIFQVPYILNKIQYLEPVSGISYSTNQSIKNIVTYSDNVLKVDLAGTMVMYNKRFVGVEARTPGAIRTVYNLKRQEFLYVDILKSWAIAGYKPAGYTHGEVQHGNYVAAVTDERGTIPQAAIVSPDKNYIRYILLATGNSPYMIIKNNLPQTPTVEQVKEIVQEQLAGNIEPDVMVSASTWAAKNKLREEQLRKEYNEKVSTDAYVGKWYGVQYTEQDVDNTTRINSAGDDNLHIDLPIQSLMRSCVVKDGEVVYYLHPENKELKEDGSPSKLDGTDGNVMVEIPEFFYLKEWEGTGDLIIKLKISQDALPGFIFSPKMYCSAYEATIDRDLNKLVSVCTTNFNRATEVVGVEATTGVNRYVEGSAVSLGSQKTAVINSYSLNAARYRGGVNNSTLDAATGNEVSRVQLGRPAANLTREDIRHVLSDNEFMYLYDTHKALFMLAYIEFATKDIQKAIIAKTPGSVTAGGLGWGATVYPDYDSHANFYLPYGGISLLPCGITNNLGNGSGEVYYKILNAPVASEGDKETFEVTRFANLWMPVMCYRGIENYYGHIYKIADQVNIIATATGNYAPGHPGEAIYQITDISYFYEPNPYLTNVFAIPKKKIWQGQFQGYARIKKLLPSKNAHVLPIDAETFNYSNAYYDCTEIFPQGANRVIYPTFNGRIVSYNLVGYNFIVGMEFEGDVARASDGTRLVHF